MILYSMILDAILIIISIIIIVGAYRRGFLRSVILFVGAIISIILSIYLSRYISGLFYQNFLRNGIIEKVNSVLTNGLENIGAAEMVSVFLDSLPKLISNTISTYFGGETQLLEQFSTTISSTSSDLGTVIADQVISPIVISLIQTISCIVIFFICMTLVKLFSRVFNGLYSVPILGSINSFLGGAIGVGEAAIWIFIIASIGKMALAIVGNDFKYFNTDVIQNSYIFKFFYDLKFI